MDCVRSVKKSGKDESSSYAICAKSTGWKKKKNGWRNEKSGDTYEESSKFDVFVKDILSRV